jgi:hypothetical protein
MHGVRPLTEDGLPDFFFQDQPMVLTQARAYFMVKNLQAWGAAIRLHPWDSWDRLADRLDRRWAQHIWHPSHWDEMPPAVNGTRQGDHIDGTSTEA